MNTAHIVHCGRDVNEESRDRIRKALEERFPTGAEADFYFKLTPLSVGAWLLILYARGESDCDILGCNFSRLDVHHVLASAKSLVRRCLTSKERRA